MQKLGKVTLFATCFIGSISMLETVRADPNSVVPTEIVEASRTNIEYPNLVNSTLSGHNTSCSMEVLDDATPEPQLFKAVVR